MFSYLKGTIGEVHSVNEKDYTVRVKLLEYDGQITEFLQVTTLLSYGKTSYNLPDVNTPVLVVFFDDDTDKGFVIGGFFSEKNKCSGTKDQIIFDCEGNYICLDRKSKKIKILSKESIEISSTKEILFTTESFFVNAKNINLKGENIKIEGSTEVSIKSKIINILGEIKSNFIIYAKDFLKI